jgi:serine/alanine racemase
MEVKTPAAAQRETLCGVDLARFLCAVLVVTIHIAPLGANEHPAARFVNFFFQQYLSRIAVPFFFVAAGYFLFRKQDMNAPDLRAVVNYVLKIARLYGLWMILLVVGDTLHLWYMRGVVIAVLAVTVMLWLRLPWQGMAAAALCLYAIGMLGDTYYGLVSPLKQIPILRGVIRVYEETFYHTRNGLFMGTVFVLMGAWLSQGNLRLRRGTAWAGLAVSAVLMFAEARLIYHWDAYRDTNMYLMLLPTVFFLFCVAKDAKIQNPETGRKLRIAGSVIYFSHMLVRWMITWVLENLGQRLDMELRNSLLILLLTVVLSGLLGFWVEKLSRKEEFAFLKYLYS